MPTVKLFSTVGGLIQGLFGNYQAGSDGVITVDTRDAPPLLANGKASYVTNRQGTYTTPVAPLAATSGQVIASGSLSNGTVSISNAVDVMRQVNFVWGNGSGTVPISAGNAAITYTANDGQVYTENVALAPAGVGTLTHSLLRGVTHLFPPVFTGVAGGTTPFRHFDTTAYIAVPVDPAAQDYSTVAEALNGAFETGGWTDSTASIGCVSPNTAPNGTRLFSLYYNFAAPVI
jgi:hypothetical protein